MLVHQKKTHFGEVPQVSKTPGLTPSYSLDTFRNELCNASKVGKDADVFMFSLKFKSDKLLLVSFCFILQ